MTIPFAPNFIYVEKSVADLPLTQKILKYFATTPSEVIADPKQIKRPAEMTWAKKGLLLARFKADHPLKSFDALGESAGWPSFSLNLISNCHLECTYCILQSYLSNNPLITIYTNFEEVFEKLAAQLEIIPQNAVIGTGHIADSLALEPITGYSATLISFFAKQNLGPRLELKTKSDNIDSILKLDHNQKTVVSWSMNPQTIAEREEYKTANVAQRLAAAKKCAATGYKIGFHLDPMILHEGWKENYRVLIEEIFAAIPPNQIAWMSLGVLRFPNRQKKIIENRFPKNQNLFDDLKHSHLPYLTYEPALRKEMLETVAGYVKELSQSVELYYCMENEIA